MNKKCILEFSMHVREEVFVEVPHRQFVFTVPKRLRIYFRFNHKILRKPQNLFIFSASEKIQN